MPRKIIDLTTQQANGKLGEPAKTAFGKVNDNFAEMYILQTLLSGNYDTSGTLPQMQNDISAAQLAALIGTTFWRASNNAQAPTATGIFTGLHIQREAANAQNTGNAVQLAIGASGQLYTRFRTGTGSGTWGAWRETWNKDQLAVQIHPFDQTIGRVSLVGQFGFGGGTLPTTDQGISGGATITDLNNTPIANSRFMGSQLANAPLGNTGWFLIDQLVHNNNWISQEAYGMAGLDYRRFWRQKNSNTWSAWMEVVCAPQGMADTGWLALTLQSGWVAHPDGAWGGIAYRRKGGYVELSGLIANGNSGAGAVIAQLPVGCRPEMSIMLPVPSNTGIGVMDINTAGVLSLRQVPSPATWLALHCLRFPAFR